MKKTLRRMICLLLAICMLPLGGLTAWAADVDTVEPEDTYVADGVTYYNVKSENFGTNTKQFIHDLLLTNHSSLSGDANSISEIWKYLSWYIMDAVGTGTEDSDYKEDMDDLLGRLLTWSNDTVMKGEMYYGDNDDIDLFGSRTGEEFKLYSTGIQYANSISSAAQFMENRIYRECIDAGSDQDGQDEVREVIAHNSTLAEYDDEQTTFYFLAATHLVDDYTNEGDYQAVGMIFSDFSVDALFPEDDGHYYTRTESAEDFTEELLTASSVRNLTSKEVTASQSVSTSYSVSSTSSVSGSETISYGQGIKIGNKINIISKKWELNIEVHADFGQAYSTGWGTSESVSDSQSTSYNVSVTLPPDTAVMLTQKKARNIETITYQSPVVLNFTVIVVEYAKDPSSDNDSLATTKILAEYSTNARSRLHEFAVINQAFGDPHANYIRWVDMSAEARTFATLAATHAPFSPVGAVMETQLDYLSTEVAGMAALYPLTKIYTVRDHYNYETDGISKLDQIEILEYNLNPGDYIYVDNIPLVGFNTSLRPFLAFHGRKGYWQVVDAKGNVVEDSPIAYMETDPVSNTPRMVAGEQTGTMYLKYFIDETAYKLADGQYCVNDDLLKTATIEINVQDEPFTDGTIRVTGELAHVVGDSPLNIDEVLKTVVMDSTDKQVNRAVTWEAQELESAGILVADNQISFTKEGTFHIRARVGDVYSDWIEVTALPAREMASIAVPERLVLNHEAGSASINLDALAVSIKDQYGDAMDPASQSLTWNCDSAAAVIDGSTITFTESGTYRITASYGNITSSPMQITIVSDEAIVESAVSSEAVISGRGGEITLSLKGAKLPDGIMLTDAEHGISAITTGTEIEQYAMITLPANYTAEDVVYNFTNELTDDVITVTVKGVAIDADYSVSLKQSNVTAKVGETFTVAMAIDSADKTSYNACHIDLAYDNSVLEFVGADIGNEEHEVVNDPDAGTITLSCYGSAMDLGNINLTFKAISTGVGNIELLYHPGVDSAENADENDLPPAELLNTTVTVDTNKLTVTISDDFIGESSVNAGDSYTFTAKDTHYDYDITVMMGEKDVSESLVDNGDGSYTVNNVTANLVVTNTKSPKTYTVVIDGTGKDDVTNAAETATYLTDYTFTINKATNFNYSVNATADNKAIAVTQNGNGSYVIAGKNVIGNLVISVTKTELPANTTVIEFTGNGSGEVVGGTTQQATIGQDFIFEITPEVAYNYSVKAFVSGEKVEAITKNEADGTYTIAADYITDAGITVEVTKVRHVDASLSVSEYVKLDGAVVYLVTCGSELAADETLVYDGVPMYFSEQYITFAWLVISTSKPTVEEISSHISTAKAVSETLKADYDVNGTGKVDENDAQLTYNMYNAVYNGFDECSVKKFLKADTNNDRKLNVNDSRAIIAWILK